MVLVSAEPLQIQDTQPTVTAELSVGRLAAGANRQSTTAPVNSGSASNTTAEIDEILASWQQPDTRFYADSTAILDEWNEREQTKSKIFDYGRWFGWTLFREEEWRAEEARLAQTALAEGNTEWGQEYQAQLQDRTAAAEEHQCDLVKIDDEPAMIYPTDALHVPRPSKRVARRLGLPPKNLSYALADKMIATYNEDHKKQPDMQLPNLRQLVTEKTHELEVRDILNIYLHMHPDTAEKDIDDLILQIDADLLASPDPASPFDREGIYMETDYAKLPKPHTVRDRIQRFAHSASKLRHAATPARLFLLAKDGFNAMPPKLRTATLAVACVGVGASIWTFLNNFADTASHIANDMRQGLSEKLRP